MGLGSVASALSRSLRRRVSSRSSCSRLNWTRWPVEPEVDPPEVGFPFSPPLGLKLLCLVIGPGALEGLFEEEEGETEEGDEERAVVFLPPLPSPAISEPLEPFSPPHDLTLSEEALPSSFAPPDDFLVEEDDDEGDGDDGGLGA